MGNASLVSALDTPTDPTLALYACDHGFARVAGSNTTTCQSAKWSQLTLVCDGTWLDAHVSSSVDLTITSSINETIPRSQINHQYNTKKLNSTVSRPRLTRQLEVTSDDYDVYVPTVLGYLM